MARESDANSDHWKTRFVSCQDYFAAYRQLSLPFFVFNWVFFTSLPTYGASGWPCWDVQFTEQDVPRIQAALNEEVPLCWFPAVKGRLCKFVPPIYFFGSEFWTLSKSEEAASPEELRLLFLEAVDQGRQKLERLRRKFSGGAGARIDSRRDVIPEDVRIFVWRRDGGRCVQCGGNERLEFDHIIPVSKGGGNTERNIQLLCENCNRKKSDNI
ncbi:MAG: HNH endonuclease [Verrucomicrobia bacterium]|nr:HNH endonuclease [Verrucomicrobiota bacterium]